MAVVAYRGVVVEDLVPETFKTWRICSMAAVEEKLEVEAAGLEVVEVAERF